MTFDDAVDAFGQGAALPIDAMAWVLDHWTETGPRCRDLALGYVVGRDRSERTERALFIVFHLLGEKEDTAVHRPLCRLLHDPEQADLLFGDDGLSASVPAILISTYAGDPAPLLALVDDPVADPFLRGEALMVLAYLVRMRGLPEAAFYRTLAGLAERLALDTPEPVWFGWVRAVGALGFAGLSGPAEAMMRDGRLTPEMMTPADLWDDLRAAKEDPGDTSGPAWIGIGPVASAIALLSEIGGRRCGPASGDPGPQPDAGRGPERPCARAAAAGSSRSAACLA